MSYQNKKFEFSFATEKDDRDILELYESLDFSGSIRIVYTKRPSPLNSLKKEGHKVLLPMIREKVSNKLVAIGSLVIKRGFMGGEIKNLGYLGSLKVHKDYRGKIPGISEIYKIIYEETKNLIDVYYSTILEENKIAQKILEKPRKNMPKYNLLDKYTSFFMKTGAKIKNDEFSVHEGLSEKLIMYYNQKYREDFAPCPFDYFNEKEFRIFSVKNRNGEIVGAFSLWNQTGYKQYIVTKYGGIYKFLKYFPTKILGYPPLPKENQLINYCSLSFVCSDNEKTFDFIVKKACQLGKSYDFLMIGLTSSHKYFKLLNKYKSVKYKSRLYSVEFSGKTSVKNGGINLEIALL